MLADVHVQCRSVGPSVVEGRRRDATGGPLQQSRSRNRGRSDGVAAVAATGTEDVIYLVPELCNLTGLTDRMRADRRVMQALAKHTRLSPQHRFQHSQNYVDSVHQCAFPSPVCPLRNCCESILIWKRPGCCAVRDGVVGGVNEKRERGMLQEAGSDADLQSVAVVAGQTAGDGGGERAAG